MDNSGGNNDVGSGDWLLESTDPMLDSLSDSYPDPDVFLCIC